MKSVKRRGGSTPKIVVPECRYNPENNPPRFSFKYVVNNRKFDYNSLSQDDKVNLLNTLNTIGRPTWAQLRTQNRHKSGYEIIDKKALKFNLPDGVPAECDILAFRFSGIAPMLGYRSAFGTFYIIAFDPKFEAYGHG